MDADPLGSDRRSAEPFLTPARSRIVRFGTVGSTNDEAMALLAREPSPVWVIAERQSAGRGRRRREWVSEPGNLYASHATPEPWPDEAFAILPLAASNALADAIVTAAGLDPRLKWPNDVLIERRKVSGILIETERIGPAQRTVIGFGVNVAHHPEGSAATHLAAHAPCDPAALFEALGTALARSLALLRADDGVVRTRERWLARAVGIGEEFTVRFDRSERTGRFLGLDEAGRLMLAEGARVTCISAGDVFLSTERP